MRFASLGSGSEGNGLVVEAGATRILIDCGFGVRDTAARLARLGARAANRSPRSSSRTSTPTTSAACPRSPRAIGIPVWLTFGTLDDGRRALRRHRARLRLRQPRSRSRSATSRCSRSRCRTMRASRCSSSSRDGAHRARRADRHRHVDAATSRRACPAATRWCSSATTTSTCSRASDYPCVAQAAHRRPLRPSAQRGAPRRCWRRSTRRGCSTSSPRTCRSRTTRPSMARAALAGALGCAADWIGIADQADGFGWRALD